MHLVFFVTPAIPSADVVVRYEEALAPIGDARLVWIAQPGLSSASEALAHSLRDGAGRILPSMLRTYAPLDEASSIHLITFSAGYGFARQLLKHPLDAAGVASYVALDSIDAGADTHAAVSEEHLAVFADYGRRARDNQALFWVGHGGVKAAGHANTTDAARELERRVGGVGGGFLVAAFDAEDHPDDPGANRVAALNLWGPGFVAEALVPHIARLDRTTAPPISSDPGSTGQPELRHGTSGFFVRQLQEWLTEAGEPLAPEGVNGVFDRVTERAVRRYQHAHGLSVTGVVGAPTWEALLAERPVDSVELASCWPPAPLFGAALGEADCDRLFGKLPFELPQDATGSLEAMHIDRTWVRDNIIEVVIPQLAKVVGLAQPGGCIGAGPAHGAALCHRDIAAALKALWEAWEAAGLLHLVLTFHGIWAPRMKYGSRKEPSRHARGIAFDINRPWNRMGAEPARVGERGSVRRLVPLANQHGFGWGGHSPQLDGNHFEAIRKSEETQP